LAATLRAISAGYFAHVSKDSPETARRLMVRFLAAFRLLAQRPELGHVREDLPVPALRFWPVGCYLAIYISEKQPIEIVAVVHGVRDVPSVIDRDL
jgi:plasmid stabilization system protein ParE